LVENALLSEIILLHRDHYHLTVEELAVRMEDGANGTERVDVLDSLQELKRSGVIRATGDVIEPTYTALRTAEILQLP
jgi:hypothetical protein